MPTLRALECLVAVLDSGSVTEAAARLHLSQPALSHQIAALERELGTPVLERLPRGVRATAAGRAVAADARAAVAAAERVVAGGRAVAAGAQGQLRIACADSMSASLLAPVLRAWHRRRPGIHLVLAESSSADAMAEMVSRGTADLALGPRPSRWEGHLVVIGTEEIVAVSPPDAAKRPATVTLADIAARPVVHYHSDNGLGAWLDDVAARRGVVLTAATRTRQATTAAQLAAAGLGTALVPTSALPATFSGVVRSLRPTLVREVVGITATPSDPLVRRFLEDLRRRGIPVPSPIAVQLTARE
ncbi:LysR family transcriptional regulator [Nocardia sp. CY41]|uniref:LysR family transcriptional regulator n=1 Tax=Nocardia sp. CY41 TaxID=2608686 RepID=UPI00135AAF3C|nr:LysR family transcriptional regulator [Nocardia sp. CY41]